MRVQMIIYASQNLIRQALFFKQMPETANAALIGNASAKAIKTEEFLEAHAVVKRLFHGWIAQIMPELQEMDPQH